MLTLMMIVISLVRPGTGLCAIGPRITGDMGPSGREGSSCSSSSSFLLPRRLMATRNTVATGTAAAQIDATITRDLFPSGQEVGHGLFEVRQLLSRLQLDSYRSVLSNE